MGFKIGDNHGDPITDISRRVILNAPSSTIKAATGYGAGVALLLSFIAKLFPDVYASIPPGTEGYLVLLVGSIMGYRQKEKVLK